VIKQVRFKPRLAITTSRSPPRRTRSFLTDLCLSIPGLTKIARGGKGFPVLIDEIKEKQIEGLFIVMSKQGNPSRIDYYNLKKPIPNKRQIIPEFSLILSGISLSREIGKKDRPAFNFLEPPKTIPSWLEQNPTAMTAFQEFLDVIKYEPDIKQIENNNILGDNNLTTGILSIKRSRRNNLLNFSFIEKISNEEVGPRIFVISFKKYNI